METKSNINGRGDTETLADAALRLLGRLEEARKYRAAGSGQAAPIHDRLSKSQAMRRLGLSEEKDRRQSPQRVADNDNGRKGPREKLYGMPRSRGQWPCQGEWEEWHGCEKSGRVDFVLRCLRAGGETATSPNRDDVSYTDRAELEGSTLPEYAK